MFCGLNAHLKASSYEVDLFIKGLRGYEKSIKNLKARNELLGNQVLPALQSEILSGEKPPYEFNCTMVMTDINNYSHIYDNYPKEEFIKLYNRFRGVAAPRDENGQAIESFWAKLFRKYPK